MYIYVYYVYMGGFLCHTKFNLRIDSDKFARDNVRVAGNTCNNSYKYAVHLCHVHTRDTFKYT